MTDEEVLREVMSIIEANEHWGRVFLCKDGKKCNVGAILSVMGGVPDEELQRLDGLTLKATIDKATEVLDVDLEVVEELMEINDDASSREDNIERCRQFLIEEKGAIVW
jgi:hypothetical protein